MQSAVVKRLPANHANTALAAALCAALGVVAATHTDFATALPATNVWPVLNCDDDGFGSLRAIIEIQAASGDTVDLRQLTCSSITLTTGDIAIAQDSLTILGSGYSALTIQGSGLPNNTSRVLTHTGNGLLSVKGMTISNSQMQWSAASADGACINSLGDIDLDDVELTDCRMLTVSGAAAGGAIHATGDVALTNSSVYYSGIYNAAATANAYTLRGGAIAADGNLSLTGSFIFSNRIHAATGGKVLGGGVYAAGNLSLINAGVIQNQLIDDNAIAKGGGVFAHGNVYLSQAQIADNQCQSQLYSVAGGIFSRQAFDISDSAITGNSATRYTGMMTIGTDSDDQRLIRNSTIANNTATVAPAGIYAIGSFTLDNSTVAFNTATQAAADGDAGIRALMGVVMHSALLANNTAAGVAADIRATVSGSHNLIFAPGASAIPPDTLVGQDPLLGPLDFINDSMMLGANSPARNAGSNPANLPWDQRGQGFTRVAEGQADIGAVEFHPQGLSFTPSVVDFGQVALGASVSVDIVMRYEGEDEFQLTAYGDPDAPFALNRSDSFGCTLGWHSPRSTCLMHATFAPQNVGIANSAITVTTVVGTFHVPLHGIGTDPDLIFANGFDF